MLLALGAGVGQPEEMSGEPAVLRVSLLSGFCRGEIMRERLGLRDTWMLAACEELSRAGLDRIPGVPGRSAWVDVHSVGVQGDERTYGNPIVLRPVSSEDAGGDQWTGRACLRCPRGDLDTQHHE